MIKRILALVMCLMMLFTTNVFAYRWVEYGTDWYVLNEDSGEYLKGLLLDVGDNVYYLDAEGKLVTGWWRNPTTKKCYFFDNKLDRNYGGMIFGLHMIDGYYYYFGDDGALQTSGEKDGFKKVYQEYYADKDGYLYYDNTLMRDTSIAKSEFYTNPLYYTNVNLNNYYLANFDKVGGVSDIVGEEKSEINMAHAAKEATKTSGSNTSGGTNYSVDDEGRIHLYDNTFETQAAEKYGPMNIR